MFLCASCDIDLPAYDSLPNFPPPIPILCGKEVEIYEVHSLPHFPSPPASIQPTLRDDDIDQALLCTQAFLIKSRDSVFVELALRFHHTYHNMDPSDSDSYLQDRLVLQVLLVFIFRIHKGSLAYRKRPDGSLEYMSQAPPARAPGFLSSVCSHSQAYIPSDSDSDSDHEIPHAPRCASRHDYPPGFQTRTASIRTSAVTLSPVTLVPAPVLPAPAVSSKMLNSKIIKDLLMDTGLFCGDGTDPTTLREYLRLYSIKFLISGLHPSTKIYPTMFHALSSI